MRHIRLNAIQPRLRNSHASALCDIAGAEYRGTQKIAVSSPRLTRALATVRLARLYVADYRSAWLTT